VSGLTIQISSLLLGSMIFFVVIVAPSIFKALDRDNTLKLTRTIFPRFYLWGIALSAAGIISSLVSGSKLFFPLLLVAAGFIYSRQILGPRMVLAKDRWLENCLSDDESTYKSLHKTSVIINVMQMALLLLIVVSNQLGYAL
jgi:hypothetical protein